MNNSDQLREVLKRTAQDISSASRDPNSWRASVVALLEMMEIKTQDRMIFESMLSDLCDDLAMRIEDGRWHPS